MLGEAEEFLRDIYTSNASLANEEQIIARELPDHIFPKDRYLYLSQLRRLEGANFAEFIHLHAKLYSICWPSHQCTEQH